MKTIALLLACCAFLLSSMALAQSGAWIVGERDGRKCLLTPEGKPFMVLGISHASLAMSERGVRPLADSERGQREAQKIWNLSDTITRRSGVKVVMMEPMERSSCPIHFAGCGVSIRNDQATGCIH